MILANVDELFPPQEVARRVTRWRRFWGGEAMDAPMLCPVCWKTNYNNVLDRQVLAERVAADLRIESRWACDNVPAVNGMIGTCALASAFGGNVRQTDDGRFWIDPIVHEPADVYSLRPPDVLAGLVGQSVQRYRWIADRLDGYLPPRVPDMQGPLNTASMLWRQEDFLVAMYEAPQAVHHLLGLVTDHIIAVYRYYRDTFPDANLVSWPFVCMPGELGVGMTEDFMHLMSPGLYEQFGLPYVNRVAREFGGVFIHCCGVFRQHWDAVRRFENLRGLDTMYPFSHPRELGRAFPNVAHVMWLDYAEDVRTFRARGPHAFQQFLLDHTPPDVRRIWCFPAEDEPSFEAQASLIRRHWQGSHPR